MISCHVNEFAIRSEIPLPIQAGLQPAPSNGARPCLEVRRQSLEHIPCMMRTLRRRHAYDVGTGVLIEPKHARLYVANEADTILVDAEDGHLGMAALWVTHLGLAMCTLFRGGLPLHGAGAEMDSHYFGVMARSGTGKSTLTGALLQGGARFGNDDLIPVYFEGESAVATPSVCLYPKLHKTALECMGVDWSTLTEAAGDHEEYWLPMAPCRRIPEAAPLRALFLLEPGDRQDGITAVRLDPIEAALQLPRHMHGVWASLSHVSHDTLMPLYRRLAESVPVYTLHYRRSFETLPRLVEAIRNVLNDPPAGRREYCPAVQIVKA